MAQLIPTTGNESSVTDHHTIGGTIVFVAVLAGLLLAATYPVLAAATVLGAISAHVVGTVYRTRRRQARRYDDKPPLEC